MYCQRGEMQNRIKEQQLDRFADRAIWARLGRVPNPETDVPTIIVEFVSKRKRDRIRNYTLRGRNLRVVPAGLASSTDRLSHRARHPASNPARTRIDSDFPPEESDAWHRARFHHPHPRGQEKREAVSPTSQGLLPKAIGRLARIAENTRRSSLRPFPAGGVERLKRLNVAKPVRALADHRAAGADDFRPNPPRSPAQAAAASTRITGLRRGRTPVRGSSPPWG